MIARNMAVIIASKGRPDCLAKWVENLDKQICRPEKLIFSVSSLEDLPEELKDSISLVSYPTVILSPPGSSHQRNRAISILDTNIEIVVFFDDDFALTNYTLCKISEAFEKYPEAVALTGNVIEDGGRTPGLTWQEARVIIDKYEEIESNDFEIYETIGLYGCNMAFRMSAIGEDRFDEKMPLYAWQEDVDFGERLRLKGHIYKTNAFAGVHLGVKNGRTSGVRFGYSQVANVIYLIKKGTMPRKKGYELIIKNVISNHVKSFWPEEWIDRRGRLTGNWIAICHLFYGKLDPEYILNIN